MTDPGCRGVPPAFRPSLPFFPFSFLFPWSGGVSAADLVDAPLGSGFGDNIIRRPGKMGPTDQRETYVNMNMLMLERDYTDLKTFQ